MQPAAKLTPLLRRRQISNTTNNLINNSTTNIVNNSTTNIVNNSTNNMSSSTANNISKNNKHQPASSNQAKKIQQHTSSGPPSSHLGREGSNISSSAAAAQTTWRSLLKRRRSGLVQPQLLADLALCTLAVFLAGLVLRTAIELLPPQVNARQEEDDQSQNELSGSDAEPQEEEEQKPKKEKVGFRDRKIIDYENRIRAFSTPDKIFRYFASYRSTTDQEIYMTPADFLRSITPGIKQPDGVGLDQYKRFEPGSMGASSSSELDLPPGSLFNKLGKKGLISFCDYVFLLTILSTSKRQFEIAFRMFDLNGDGDVDAEEFARVQNIIRATQGRQSKQPTNKQNHSAIFFHFFGEKLDGTLTISQFLHFQNELQGEILRLEFNRKDPEDGIITEKQLAELLLTYANFSVKRRNIVLKRVKRLFKDDAIGVTLEDYKKIFEVLVHIEDIDKALTFHHLAGSSIGPPTLQHVAKVCAGVSLSDHLVSVIFVIFDEDGDGSLSKKEFISVMKNTLKRGLDKDETKGISDLFSSIFHCATT